MNDKKIESICVYLGSSLGIRSEYKEAAESLGRALVHRNIRLVYGGGRLGLMGALASTVHAGAGRSLSIIPQALHGARIFSFSR
jgi:predicted Rossmann-fold nucleotide-binding protein